MDKEKEKEKEGPGHHGSTVSGRWLTVPNQEYSWGGRVFVRHLNRKYLDLLGSKNIRYDSGEMVELGEDARE